MTKDETSQYENIHCHSGIGSIRDGLAKIDELAIRNKELGMKSLCVTDHGSVLAMTDVFKQAEKHGLNPVVGCELYTVDEDYHLRPVGKKGEIRGHFILIPKTWEAMTRLFKIMTHGAKNKFCGFPRVSYQYLLDADLSDMWVSAACSVGFLSSPRYEQLALAFQEKCNSDFYLEIIPVSYIDNKATKIYNDVLVKIDTNEEISASERLYVSSVDEDSVTTNGIDGGRLANERAVYLHKKHGIRLVATNDSHYVYKEDAVTHEVLLAVNSGKKMDDPNRWMFGDGEIYVKSFDEMLEAFDKLGYISEDVVRSALIETKKIAEDVNIIIPKFYADLPSPTPEIDDVKALRALVMRGMKKYKIKEKKNKEKYFDRIKEEMAVLKEFGLERYFLIVADIYDFMRESKIPHGFGRGSVGGSLVAYLCGITYIDSVEYDCIFSRFINAGRMEKSYDKDGKVMLVTDDLCDIDCDVSKKRRGEVIQYIRDKYGSEYVSQISNYNRFTPKSAFKAVSSAYAIPFKEANELSSFIEEGVYLGKNGDSIPYDELGSFEHHPRLKIFFKHLPHLLKHVLKLNGTMSALGKHAGGVIVSNTPICNVCPIDIRGGVEIASLDMNDISKRGCLKLDMLGIATSDQFFNSCWLANVNPYTVPLKDKKTTEMLIRGDTPGVFQLESFLARKTLKESGKGELDDIVGINAVIRPGALQAKDKNDITTYNKFVKCANGSMDIEYLVPELKDITKNSYSCIIFQEQVLRIFNKLAGFSLQESDIIRRAVGKKKLDVIGEYRGQFISGCGKNDISSDDANEIFNLVLNSASYLFNYSHSLAYSQLSFRSAYMKANYPLEFWTATLTYSSKDDLMPEYIRDASRHGVKVNYPDINISSAKDFTIHNGEIIAPLNSIKNVGDKAADHIVNARNANTFDQFDSYDDFLKTLTKMKLNGKVNKRVKDCLYRSNAFKSLGYFVEDKAERRKNLREILSLFSPIPVLNLNSGRGYDKKEYEELITTMKKCNKGSGHGRFVEDVVPAAPSIVIIIDMSKQATRVLDDKISWIHVHLSLRLGVPKSKIALLSARKCSFYNIDKDKINTECKTLCSREFIHRQLSIIKPKLVINTAGYLSSWIANEPKLKFSESIGSLYYNGTTEKGFYCLNAHGPAWINYSSEAKSDYEKTVLPLLSSLKKDKQ